MYKPFDKYEIILNIQLSMQSYLLQARYLNSDMQTVSMISYLGMSQLGVLLYVLSMKTYLLEVWCVHRPFGKYEIILSALV